MVVVLQLHPDRLTGALFTGRRNVTKSVAIIVAFHLPAAGSRDVWTVDRKVPGGKAPVAVNRIGKRTGHR